MKIKFYFSDIIMVLFFQISFITLPYLQSYNTIKYVIIAITAIYLFPKYKIFMGRDYRKINALVIIFITIIIITSFINRRDLVERDVFLAGIVYSAIVFEAFLLFQYFSYKGRMLRGINILYYLTLGYIIFTDLLIIIKPELFLQNYGYYFIGNKFAVSYLHFQLIALYWYKCRNNEKLLLRSKLFITAVFILTIFISLQISSSSGIAGSLILVLFIIFNKQLSNILTKPSMAIITLLAACSILLLFDTVLNSNFMQFIIEDVLGRDMTLTGRMPIYNNFNNLISGHFWTGYGHGSTYEVCMRIMGAPNTQNGLFEILMQYGVFGVVSIISLIYVSFKKIKITNEIFPIVAMVYVYMLLASIEITLSLRFLSMLSIIASMQKQTNITNGSNNKSCITSKKNVTSEE